MKVTAFLRPQTKVGKNNTSALTHVYFRLRDPGVDIKAVSELAINPNHWSQERQGYKPRVSVVPLQEQTAFDQEVQNIISIISEKYRRGVNGDWMKGVIEEYHHPNINKGNGMSEESFSLIYRFQDYLKNALIEDESKRCIANMMRKVERYERFQRAVMHRRNFTLRIDTLSVEDLYDILRFLKDEAKLLVLYPKFYENEKNVDEESAVRGDNTLYSNMKRLRTVLNWCIKRGYTDNDPFRSFEIPTPLYGEPFYLTLDELDKVYSSDLSQLSQKLQIYRDVFAFQCLLGCRLCDLNLLTKNNIIDDCIVYVPQKTRKKNPEPVRVPIINRLKAIIEKYSYLEEAIVPRVRPNKYNDAIKEILKYLEINRIVPWLNPKTRQVEMRPICEVATSHTARKTFCGNLYQKVKDPNIVGSMSGHVEGSQAFSRYRHINDDIKKDVIKYLDMDE